jgi:hypothetical protein
MIGTADGSTNSEAERLIKGKVERKKVANAR